MKTNKKIFTLIDEGLSHKSISKLTESQIDILFSRLISEQVTPVPAKKTYKVGPKGGKIGNVMVSPPDPNTKEVMVTTEEEMSEENNKNDKNNPWAICHKQLGPKRNAKFESCVKQVKKSLKEGKNPVSLFIENKIMEIVETHLPPKITKKDLVKYLSEAEPATAPVKEPKTKPGTKQPPSPVKTPSHPGKNPNPGVKEAPRAVDAEEAKEKIIDTIMKMLKK
jgi:hypothetical protein